MTKEEILNEIENNPLILEEIYKKYLSDAEFMLKVLKKSPVIVFRFIDNKLLDNYQFIKKALFINRNILDITSNRVKRKVSSNKKIITKYIEDDPFVGHTILQYTSKKLKSDEKFIYSLFLKSTQAVFHYITNNLKDNKKFIKRSIEKKDGVFNYASHRLRGDLELINMVMDDIESLKTNDPESFYNNPTYYPNCVYNIRAITNKNYILDLVKQYPVAFLFLSEEYQKDIDILKFAIKGKGMIEFIPKISTFKKYKKIFNKVLENLNS